MEGAWRAALERVVPAVVVLKCVIKSSGAKLSASSAPSGPAERDATLN